MVSASHPRAGTTVPNRARPGSALLTHSISAARERSGGNEARAPRRARPPTGRAYAGPCRVYGLRQGVKIRSTSGRPARGRPHGPCRTSAARRSRSPRKVLTQRLEHLLVGGFLERRPYQKRPHATSTRCPWLCMARLWHGSEDPQYLVTPMPQPRRLVGPVHDDHCLVGKRPEGSRRQEQARPHRWTFGRPFHRRAPWPRTTRCAAPSS
jgi:hypothetical protein